MILLKKPHLWTKYSTEQEHRLLKDYAGTNSWLTVNTENVYLHWDTGFL